METDVYILGKDIKSFSIYSASLIFRDEIFEHLKSSGIISNKYTQKNGDKKCVYTVVISKKKELKLLYNKSNVFLERKRCLF